MATHDLDTLYCRFIDHVINHQRLDHLDQFLAAEVVEHGPGVTVGLAAARQTLAAWLAAFPDLHLVIEDLVVEGDRLMARLTATGTHRGPLAGLAGFPSHGDPEVALGALASPGKRVRVPLYEAWSVPDGRCAERWLQLDGRQRLAEACTAEPACRHRRVEPVTAAAGAQAPRPHARRTVAQHSNPSVAADPR